MVDEKPLLVMQDIVKQYSGVLAVNHASLSLLPGEVHGLVGGNGAGKSTLIKIMAGVVRPDHGQILLDGARLDLRDGSGAYRHGLSFIHQELNLVPYLSGAENIFLGRPYPKTRFGTIDWQVLNRRADEIMRGLGMRIRVDVPVGRLSRGEQAMISLGRAFVGDARIIVMDEPTAALTDEEIRSLFRVIRALKARGRTVLYVSHRLGEIFEICDRVTVMRDGSVVGSYPIGGLSQSEMIRLMIGRSLGEGMPSARNRSGRVFFRAEALAGGPVQGVSFDLREGEILGLAGLVGAGRSEVLHLLYGSIRPKGGRMWMDDKLFAPRSPAEAIRAGLAMVPEERHRQGLVLNRSVLHNITLPALDRFTRRTCFVNRAAEHVAGQKLAQRVQLKAASLDQRVNQLSGGNQQKVVFARWLHAPPRMLLLDEPTRGVDVAARFEIYRIIRELAATGVGIVLVSSDLPELLSLADRLIVLREGRQLAELPTAGMSQETLLHYCYGEVPRA
ncbi:MAG: sugar ABC transporter ATP-binding protein [Chloroflexi bacterium]|jgi:ribose transport system ATP-binding protein|uniref:sugar ABC transporter ATP-binding protein n=1 Tax=Candidatus Roseilinea sp. NK_OTU-006 TaxID=2704250 RepID=UPI000F13B1B8|nr:sugar ABC transporter ATP-binding protein [Candidatus Roseilinea sp. NK_OTU-006]RMG66254.1 MAG: sugar ABC transporter ATP-binding protein [Chloroflexota bacterium]